MIRVIGVGKLKAKWARAACQDYLDRCGRWARIEVVEIADSDPATESKAVLDTAGQTVLVACDRQGEDWDTERLAELLSRHGGVAFAIGGPEGHDPSLLGAATHAWRFGRITLPHELARVVLLEQVYRALSIRHGHPYHR